MKEKVKDLVKKHDIVAYIIAIGMVAVLCLPLIELYLLLYMLQ